MSRERPTRESAPPAAPFTSVAWSGMGAALYAHAPGPLEEHQHAPLQLLAPLTHHPLEARWREGVRSIGFRAGAQEVCLVGPGVPHAFAWEAQARVVSLFLTPEWLARVTGEARPSAALAALGPARLCDPLVRELLRALGEALTGSVLPSRAYVEGAATVLGMHLSRVGVPSERAPAGLRPWQLRRLEEYVEAHLHEDVGLEALAEVLGMSASHFARCFRRATGTTPHRFLMERRLERARALVLTTERPLADVAQAAGFASQSHLTLLFRARFATTPARLRRDTADERRMGARAGR